MGQAIWILAGAAAIGGAIGLSSMPALKAETRAEKSSTKEIAQVSAEIGAPITFNSGSSGRALAAAAFGMDALQPETYDGELVRDIIAASHLDRYEKRDLAADLRAAEAGRADLDTVLADLRVALAVE